MPSGIVALLDDISTAKIAAIWAEFQATFGVHGVSRTPIAHFSFHVAEAYDAVTTIPTVLAIAKTMPPFTVRTAGLGIFTGMLPVVHIPVVRNERLAQIHALIWRQMAKCATGIFTYYHPDHWQPHITLAQGDIPTEKLPQLIAMLQERDFNWEIEVTRLGFIADTGGTHAHKLQEEFVLKG
jgi:2'-5' RNA ligase